MCTISIPAFVLRRFHSFLNIDELYYICGKDSNMCISTKKLNNQGLVYTMQDTLVTSLTGYRTCLTTSQYCNIYNTVSIYSFFNISP